MPMEWFSASKAQGVKKSPGWDALMAKIGPSEPRAASGDTPTEAGVTPGEHAGSADATQGGRPE